MLTFKVNGVLYAPRLSAKALKAKLFNNINTINLCGHSVDKYRKILSMN